MLFGLIFLQKVFSHWNYWGFRISVAEWWLRFFSQTSLWTGDIQCKESSSSAPVAASSASQQQECEMRNISTLNWIEAFLSWQTFSSHTTNETSAFLIKHIKNGLGYNHAFSQWYKFNSYLSRNRNMENKRCPLTE